MHLSVFERIRVADLYYSLKGYESFTKKCDIVSGLARQIRIEISGRRVRDLIRKCEWTSMFFLSRKFFSIHIKLDRY